MIIAKKLEEMLYNLMQIIIPQNVWFPIETHIPGTNEWEPRDICISQVSLPAVNFERTSDCSGICIMKLFMVGGLSEHEGSLPNMAQPHQD